MIYAYQIGEFKTIVAAATSVAEFDDFYARAVADRQDYTAERQPEFADMLTDTVFQRLRKPPFIFDHMSPSQRDAFITRYAITVLGPNAVISKAEAMIDTEEFVRKSADGEEDTRTIGEIFGIDKDDPWDKRSDEDKAKDAEAKEQHKQAYDKAKKQGILSGDSFGAKIGAVARVTDITHIQKADGTMVIGDVRAAKRDGAEEVHPAYQMEEDVRVREDFKVNPGDYYRADPASPPQSRRPRDYCYAVYTDEAGETLFALTPRRTFKFSKKMEDRPLSAALADSLPEGAEERENGLFAYTGSVEDIADILKAEGFQTNEDFQKVFTPPSPEQLLAEEQERQDRDRAEHPDNYEGEDGTFTSKNPDDWGFGVSYPAEVGAVTVHVCQRRIFEITKNYQPGEELPEGLELPAGFHELMEGVYTVDLAELEVDETPDLSKVPADQMEAVKKKLAVLQAQQDEADAKDPVGAGTRRVKIAMEAKGFIHHAGIQTAVDRDAKAAESVEEDTGPAKLGDLGASLAKPRPSQRAKGQTPDGVIGEEHLLNEKVETGPAENFDGNGDNMAVANDGMVAIYFKVEVTGAKLAEVIPAVTEAGFPIHGAFVQRDHKAGCWFAFTRKASADDLEELLDQKGYAVEGYGIDQSGDRLIAAGANATVVDTEAEKEEPIRPWNGRRAEYEALSDEDREKNRKEWKGEEFLCTCSYDRVTGCDVFITPKSYFFGNDYTPFPETLDLSHILPGDMKPQGDGWYNSKSRDENHLMADLCVKRKFVDDWMLRLYLNQNT